MATLEQLRTLLRAHARRAKERNSIRDEPAEITREALVQMHIAEALDGLLFVALCFGIGAGMFKDE
ncbi:MAG: hypothetical protein OXR82_10920 [Gammaproteobacteria bacterium]|nr:hypothetical protein [Gammaproteobacteria bacterium]MDE0258877.1 hypothetical protein [Gammaproteobacteria bacterium]